VINSRAVEDLLPIVQPLAKLFLSNCAEDGIDTILTSTYRDRASQTALYAQGRTTPGRIITNAKPGESFHEYRVAFDFVPIVNGKAIWGDPKIFARCGSIAKGIGLEWAGDWKSFKEFAHCQYTGGLTLADLKAGKIPKELL
jgi:peptidoglycan L-alanyl-D-glutamate endopeptidase CwlK